MTLQVHPDPQRPAGGYGFLQLAAQSLPDQVTVSVQDAYSGRWLHPGPAESEAAKLGNWQTERHRFGPYTVLRNDGADWVHVGPDIVDKIEEYTALRLMVDEMVHIVIWPDTVRPSVGAASHGALQPYRKIEAVIPAPEPVKAPERPVEEPDTEVEPDADPPEPPAPSSRRLWLPVGVLLLLGAGAAAWYLIDAPDPAGPAETALIGSNASCSLPDLQKLDGIQVQLAAIRDCGRDVSPDTALRIIEDGAKAEDGAALLVFGTLYDGDALDPKIENLIGLSFADDPAQAVAYYVRARAAGSDAATERISAVCARLAGSTLTLEKGAHDDFCN